MIDFSETIFNEERISEVTEKAIEKFWEEVASQYPEIKTGDISIGNVTRFTQVAESMIYSWLQINS